MTPLFLFALDVMFVSFAAIVVALAFFAVAMMAFCVVEAVREFRCRT